MQVPRWLNATKWIVSDFSWIANDMNYEEKALTTLLLMHTVVDGEVIEHMGQEQAVLIIILPGLPH